MQDEKYIESKGFAVAVVVGLDAAAWRACVAYILYLAIPQASGFAPLV